MGRLKHPNCLEDILARSLRYLAPLTVQQPGGQSFFHPFSLHSLPFPDSHFTDISSKSHCTIALLLLDHCLRQWRLYRDVMTCQVEQKAADNWGRVELPSKHTSSSCLFTSIQPCEPELAKKGSLLRALHHMHRLITQPALPWNSRNVGVS